MSLITNIFTYFSLVKKERIGKVIKYFRVVCSRRIFKKSNFNFRRDSNWHVPPAVQLRVHDQREGGCRQQLRKRPLHHRKRTGVESLTKFKPMSICHSQDFKIIPVNLRRHLFIDYFGLKCEMRAQNGNHCRHVVVIRRW